ncbi:MULTISPECIES: acyl-CoA dehydrogenase [unclassified Rhizobium]|jgi:alkylation response protein AidB-like acyl-CoA dehydrogenase|uniref:acyl-CoA dehydrogenase n=1 Tax=unclassified Rhizobium TaxID=2613769 RepID=UPI000DE0BBCF|nr:MULTISPECIES: acyl-CoA dehydrogenase [unclassified Rhizobium]MBB3289747.1 alkylation response protein AidB-like acyl-CoA dehydrogenase [Rhizobium sp. BK252]MBB3404690.1 alkylation response protein AidB-like acyl-CoA dehydrogenase [Rhizobium sp. BK289]MBB3416938.1 alkylation response protein AidB-like acyl-CoA dehydrogenase [Rhizobium sp. BK284]MBB3484815.1 alkylation response protein AidB-like acyl-CoA dehydrogenase [Rhizobium sp. BK347]
MNAPLKHGAAYWGTKTNFAHLLEHISKIGPVLEENAVATEKLGKLNEPTFEALKPLRMSHIFATEELGGAQLSPTQGLQLIEAITYHSGAAGWVSMVHACIGAMSAAFLPDTAISRLFGGGTDNRFSGQGTPTGMLKKVDGGYLLNGKWSYASGIHHATFTHTAALLDDGNGHPAKDENGNVVVLCAHAPVGEHGLLGNWNVLGLQGTGSIDYDAKDVFIADDMVFPIMTAEPQRQKEFFSLGVVGLAAIGHSGWAIGASRRMLDEMAKFAVTKTGRAGMLGESDKFWFDYGRAEARARAARAFLFEVWRDVEASIEAGNRVSTRQITLVHLAKSEVHEAGVDACHFVYRAAGGASLRDGVMQRTYREMLVAANHFTINTNIIGAAGREIGGLWSDRVWQFYDLVEKK